MHCIAKNGGRLGRLVVTALALPVLACAQDGDQGKQLYDLHPSTASGTTTWFVESTDVEQRINMQGKDMHIDMRLTRTFGITIKQVNNKTGSRIVEIHIARVTGWTHIGDEKKSFDSKDNSGAGHGTLADRMMATVGHRFVARIDKNGKLAGSMEGVAREMRNGTVSSSVRDSELADLAQAAFGRTPTKPTAIGDTWKSVHPGIDAMITSRNATMKLAKVTDDAFVLEMSGEVRKADAAKESPDEELTDAEKQIQRMNEGLEISNGKLSGTQTLSRKDGLVLATASKASFDLNVAQGGPQQQVEVEVATSLRRTKKPDVVANKPLPPRASEAAKMKAITDTKLLADATRTFYIKNGKLPGSLADLAKKDARGNSLIEELPPDPWGNAYKIFPGDTPREFEVRSAGLDGKHGTKDDLSNKS